MTQALAVDNSSKGEIWRPVVGYEDLYEVSNLGRVRSLTRTVENSSSPSGVNVRRGKILRQSPNTDGYNKVRLFEGGVGATKKTHRLVAEAFIPNPFGLPEVNHKDKNRANAAEYNLEWTTRLENMRHAYANHRRADVSVSA